MPHKAWTTGSVFILQVSSSRYFPAAENSCWYKTTAPVSAYFYTPCKRKKKRLSHCKVYLSSQFPPTKTVYATHFDEMSSSGKQESNSEGEVERQHFLQCCHYYWYLWEWKYSKQSSWFFFKQFLFHIFNFQLCYIKTNMCNKLHKAIPLFISYN